MLRDQGICHVCNQEGADEVDHIVPVTIEARLPEHRAMTMAEVDSYYNRAPIHSTPCHRHKTQTEAERARAT